MSNLERRTKLVHIITFKSPPAPYLLAMPRDSEDHDFPLYFYSYDV